MSRMCAITGKKTSYGHNVSHSQRKTRKTWFPNLIIKKVFDKRLWRFVKMKISTSALRTLTKELVAWANQIYKALKWAKAKV